MNLIISQIIIEKQSRKVIIVSHTHSSVWKNWQQQLNLRSCLMTRQGELSWNYELLFLYENDYYVSKQEAIIAVN